MVPKFRAWDKENDRMIYPSTEDVCFELDDDGINIFDLWGEYPEDHVFPLLDSVLMQSTGLKDKNGVEIFEGDVLNIIEVTNQRLKEYLTDVKWEDCSFVVKSGGDDYDTFLAAWTGDPNTTYPLFEMQVVGNIYENPKLLEQTYEN